MEIAAGSKQAGQHGCWINELYTVGSGAPSLFIVWGSTLICQASRAHLWRLYCRLYDELYLTYNVHMYCQWIASFFMQSVR